MDGLVEGVEKVEWFLELCEVWNYSKLVVCVFYVDCNLLVIYCCSYDFIKVEKNCLVDVYYYYVELDFGFCSLECCDFVLVFVGFVFFCVEVFDGFVVWNWVIFDCFFFFVSICYFVMLISLGGCYFDSYV